MAISKNTQANIDDSNLAAYPNGQVKDDDGTGDGFPLICGTMSDIFETFDKLMRLAANTFNDSFDNEVNGFQFVNSMIALAGKNDYILSLTTYAGVLGLATKLGILNLNERLIVQAAADWTVETTVTGNDTPTPVTLTVAITRQYKAGDYLMLIKTSGGVQLVSLTTADNLSVINTELGYLMGADNAVELAGTSTAAATTPAGNLYAFTQRVTDPTAAVPFLATTSKPGLLSAAQWNAINGFSSPIKNVGNFSGVNPGLGAIGSLAARAGDIVSAEINSIETGPPGSTTYLVTIANAMSGTSYFVRTSLQSVGTMNYDNNTLSPVFSPQTRTTFLWSLEASIVSSKNLTVHIEVIQI
jgi:hypothetical protein